MKNILFALAALLFISPLYSQEYKISRSSGRLEIREVNQVSIEGHSGNEIIFTSKSQSKEKDPRADGLRALSSLGLEDNTGLGLSVVEKGDVVEVYQLKKTEGPRVTILVPRGVVVSYSHSSPFGDDIEIKNFSGELNISTVHNGVTLTNTSGAMNVKTVHGGIDAVLTTPLTAPVKLESVHGHVDVALPVTSKLNVVMGTEWGEVLVDPDFKIALERTGDLQHYSGRIRGKINGGGTEITLRSSHDNVYLRKK